MMLCALAEWLCTLAPLARFAPDGICTGTMRPGPGCSLHPAGSLSCTQDIAGNRTFSQQFTLSVCGVCLCQTQYDELYRTVESAAFAVQDAALAGGLPVLAQPFSAQSVEAQAPKLEHTDDSGLAVFTLALTLVFQKPAEPAYATKG